MNCGDRSRLALCGGVVSIRLNFLGKGALLAWGMIERRRHDDCVLTIGLVPLPGYCRYSKYLGFELRAIFLLALCLERYGISLPSGNGDATAGEGEVPAEAPDVLEN